MKKDRFCLFVLVVSVIIPFGCGDEEEVSAWANTDTDVDADTETDTDSLDTGVIPISFKVSNETSSNRYISTLSPLRFQQHEGSVQTTRQFFPPLCQLLCADVEKGDNCDIQCGPSLPAVKLIKPSESQVFAWDGVIYEENASHCGQGICQDSGPAPEGNYMVEIGVSKGYVCEYEPCSGSDLIGGAVLSEENNDYSGYSTEFAIPHTAKEVVIKIIE